jgi:hypothetical protein
LIVSIIRFQVKDVEVEITRENLLRGKTTICIGGESDAGPSNFHSIVLEPEELKKFRQMMELMEEK